MEFLKWHPKVSLIQLQSQISEINQDIRFSYRATAGTVSIPNYGIKIAEKMGLDREILNAAKRALQLLESAEGLGPEHQGVRNSLEKRKIILNVADKIIKIQSSTTLDEATKAETINSILEAMQNEQSSQ